MLTKIPYWIYLLIITYLVYVTIFIIKKLRAKRRKENKNVKSYQPVTRRKKEFKVDSTEIKMSGGKEPLVINVEELRSTGVVTLCFGEEKIHLQVGKKIFEEEEGSEEPVSNKTSETSRFKRDKEEIVSEIDQGMMDYLEELTSEGKTKL